MTHSNYMPVRPGETLESWASRVAPMLGHEGWSMAERVAKDARALGASAIVLKLGMPGSGPFDEGARALLQQREASRCVKLLDEPVRADISKLRYYAGEHSSCPLGAPHSSLPGLGLVVETPHGATIITPLGRAVLRLLDEGAR